MRIASYERGVGFNLDSELIDELTTYGIIAEGSDGMCEIVNPIYMHRILQTFLPYSSFFRSIEKLDFTNLLQKRHLQL